MLWIFVVFLITSLQQIIAIDDGVDADLSANLQYQHIGTLDWKDIVAYPVPPLWQGRDDVLGDDTNTLNHLLAKIQVPHILCINRTKDPITLHVKGVDAANVLIMEPNTSFLLHLTPRHILALDPSSTGHFNFFIKGDQYFLSVEPQRCLLFSIFPSRPILFEPNREELRKKLHQQCLRIHSPRCGTCKVVLGYRTQIRTLEQVILQDEGIDRTAFYAQRQRLYDENKIEMFLDKFLPENPKIPLNLFSIWLTNPDNPKEPEDELLEFIIKSSQTNPAQEGWKQYFVTNDPRLLPKTFQKFTGTSIKVISIQELIDTLELQAEFNQAMAGQKFGMASDILRVELLNKLGGAYLDIDLIVLQSLKPFFYLYDSLFGLQPMDEYIGNAFMAALPNHPILQEAIKLIRRNFQLKTEGNKKSYIITSKGSFDTFATTGPAMITVAYYKGAGRDGNCDFITPDIYPVTGMERPSMHIPQLTDPISPYALTLHLWKNTWTGPKGEQNGSLG